MEFPDQFDTVLGEKGITLSGGQRQRLALARAFLMSASVMILDDPLNQVDTDTAASILDAIRTIARRRTTIMVAHRISHVRHADLIIVLKDGRIVERGAHEELMKAPGFYSSMYQRQQIE
ncbi:MAG: ATP-binding cassette domain-containing protein [Desulfobacterales bacterium]|nr:ATP-binding cassette domain-containing protein [Desulfobacterales bacterium]